MGALNTMATRTCALTASIGSQKRVCLELTSRIVRPPRAEGGELIIRRSGQNTKSLKL